ncbi:cytochrome c biogenesis protein ResB, partial [Flavobacteriales bacterium]|nr:cytochrome c biogenesis protein ResB [Flavobacteriales bacterium]
MINKILKFLFSMKFAMLLLIIFAFSLGYATFIEADFGTPTARALIYNSWWLELLMMVLGISLILNMFQHKLFRKEKLATLTFHLSFIIILFGAFVTRYTSDSGLMVIEEGSSNGKFYTSDSYFHIEILDDNMPGKIYRNDKLLNLRGNFDDNPFFFLKYLSSNNFSISEKETIFSKNVLSQDFKVEYVDFLTNINDEKESQSDEMMDGMNHALVVKTTSAGDTRIDTLINFSMNDAINVQEHNKESHKNIFTLGSLTLKLWYGTKIIYLDPVKENGKTEPGFSIFLKDFQLENYPGGMNAKSFASEVEVIDGEKKIPYRIYMNNTLNYKGYRFFQNNYDKGDKKTTVLEVNYDWWGTNITYCGYLIMALGMILVFFQKKTRFRYLSEKLRKIRSKSLLVIFFLTSLVSLSQDSSINNHSDHTDLESVRKSINEMGTWISGDTIINGVSIYEIFKKGRDDIEYLVNYPIFNISQVKKYFPEIKDSMISYSVIYEKKWREIHNFNTDIENLSSKLLIDSLYVQLNNSENQLLQFINSIQILHNIITIYSRQYRNNIDQTLSQFRYDFKEEEEQIFNKYNIDSKEWREFRDSIAEVATEFIKNHKFDSENISNFERLLILDNSRIKPMHSMALKFTRKITQSNKGLYEKTPIEMFLGILSYPDYWKEVPLIKIKHHDIQKLFNKDIEYISYASYKSRWMVDSEAHTSH